MTRNYHISIEEGIWNWADAGAGAFFIQPFQYGRSRTLGSISCASRASAKDAFALDGASRPRSLLSHFPTSLKHRALRQSFQKSDKKRCGLRSPDTLEPPTISSKIPGSLGFPGCALLALLRPVLPTLPPFLQRSRSVPRPVVLDVQFLHSPGAVRAGDIPAVDRRVQTDQFCNPTPGSPLWALAPGTRSLLSCGRWFLTPHWRYPQSALGRWCLWLLRPIGYQTQASRCTIVLRLKPRSPSRTSSELKFPNFPKHDRLQTMPSLAPETFDSFH